MTNRTERCKHGFASGASAIPGIRCYACIPEPSRPPKPRSCNSITFRLGAIVAGCAITARNGDRIAALCGCGCGCGDEFTASRTLFSNRERDGSRARCRRCVARAAVGRDERTAAE